jgi:hypothetical protein
MCCEWAVPVDEDPAMALLLVKSAGGGTSLDDRLEDDMLARSKSRMTRAHLIVCMSPDSELRCYLVATCRDYNRNHISGPIRRPANDVHLAFCFDQMFV